ncbi:hypothetical protein H8959_018514 [Pygathrix nigripes]
MQTQPDRGPDAFWRWLGPGKPTSTIPDSPGEGQLLKATDSKLKTQTNFHETHELPACQSVSTLPDQRISPDHRVGETAACGIGADTEPREAKGPASCTHAATDRHRPSSASLPGLKYSLEASYWPHGQSF